MRSAGSNAHGPWQLDGREPTHLSAVLRALRAGKHLFRGSGLGCASGSYSEIIVSPSAGTNGGKITIWE